MTFRRFSLRSALRRFLAAVFGFGISTVAMAAASPPWTWFEAEEPGGASESPELSGGRMVWIAPKASLSRTISVPAAGTYTLWVRKFWNPQPFRWRIGGDSDWHEVKESNLTDLQMLGGNPGQRVGWFPAGTVVLSSGSQSFRLEPLAGDTRTTAYDCFLLTMTRFLPRGPLKPGEKSGRTMPGWFAFEPEADAFAASAIDLRSLNEPEAGAEGFIRVQGDGFVHEKSGRPARFWAVNVGMGFVASPTNQHEVFAKAMAKRGVNMVRVHGPIYQTSGKDFGKVDTRRIGQLHAFSAALKKQGIYTSLSIYFPLWVTPGPDHPDFPGYGRNQHPFALPYFSEPFQKLYRDWWKALLTTTNPATGLAFRDDPAIAFAEMINEDSTLFWTFNASDPAKSNLPEPQRAILEHRFGTWLRQRYPQHASLAVIRDRAWSGTACATDDLDAGRVGFRPLWELFNRRTARDRDTARFLAELMSDFHRATYDYLKKDLGYRGLVYCSNWKTASPRYLDPLDKHANAVGDFFDRHGYLGGLHEGPNASWNIEPGQKYDDRSALLFRKPDGQGDDFENPFFDLIYNGRPSVITEVNWPLPNRFRADMVPFGACSAATQGTDGVFWFAADAPEWDGVPGKFSIQTPTVLGQFPAAALIYRRGLVRVGAKVVDLQVPLRSLYDLEGTPVPAPQNFDTLRGADVPAGGSITNASAVDSLAFLVGRVGIDLVEKGQPGSRITDLSPFLDRQARRARSHPSGDVAWDWGRGLIQVRAESATGMAGFLAAAGAVEFPDAVIESSLEYGSILLVALDDKPLSESKRILLQVASEERPFGWATEPATGPRKIVNRGSTPLLVREFQGKVRLRTVPTKDHPVTVTPLDFNGYPETDPAPLSADGRIALRPATPYYLIETRR